MQWMDYSREMNGFDIVFKCFNRVKNTKNIFEGCVITFARQFTCTFMYYVHTVQWGEASCNVYFLHAFHLLLTFWGHLHIINT